QRASLGTSRTETRVYPSGTLNSGSVDSAGDATDTARGRSARRAEHTVRTAKAIPQTTPIATATKHFRNIGRLAESRPGTAKGRRRAAAQRRPSSLARGGWPGRSLRRPGAITFACASGLYIQA